MPYENFGQDLQQFMEAIRVRESRGSGGYQAVGVETKYGRALGAYQIMEDFWDDWAAAAGIPGADWRDPAAQDRVAKYKMANLYYKYGDWDAVAAAWIGGEGGANDFLAGQRGEKDALGTSVKSYVEDVRQLFSPTQANVAGRSPQQGGLVEGAGGGGSYGGLDVAPAAPGQTSRVPETTPLTQRQHDEKLVTSTLEHLSNKIAGGQRKSVEEIEFFPAGAKEQEGQGVEDQDVEAAGTDVQAAPTPPIEPTEGGLNSSFESALNQMMSDAPGSVSISSGYRSVARQKELWNKALKKYGDPEIADNWVARPGSSFHNHGLAADLKYESDEVKKWVHDNAAKYGIHFPLSNEDWHAEPIGAR